MAVRANERRRSRVLGNSTVTPFCYVRISRRRSEAMSQDNRKPEIRSARRKFLRTAGTAAGYGALMAMVPPGVRQAAWAAGSDAPEKKEVKVGFIPLTDCASVVMASVNEFDKKYGIRIVPTKEASWADRKS